ncbi:MAG TPA: alpha/beta hydrolase [Stellaceae bacterium]|nr:alpha/beta hydrolase [Stellaceae bacterium]
MTGVTGGLSLPGRFIRLAAMGLAASWPRFARTLLAALLLSLAAPTLAAAEDFALVQAYPDHPNAGPAAAKGAVIWNHGVNFLYGTEGADAPLPLFLRLFRSSGWDVFRLLRPRMAEEQRFSSSQIVKTAHRLKQQGYRRIVLAGQSGGAWLSLMAAGKSDDIHAVIADAPAWYGTDHPTYLMNGFVLLDYIDAIRRGRIMIGYFKNDPYDPGGRARKSAELLAAHGVPHVVLERPQGFSGHFSGNTALFVRRFGACLLQVSGDGPMPTPASCDSGWGEAPSAALPVPRDLKPAGTSGGPADPFLGKWYGSYPNGREVMLAIEHAQAGSVEAAYIIGPGLTANLKPAVSRRSGRIAEGKLVFAEPGLSRLLCTPREDGGLDLDWIAAGGGRQLDAVLHRVK